ncbi:major histocompatibility complex class I-related gene protein [Sardina pilchardus]|uniref:major histocompatibility complex class I-related gene protein n=1 Tax=Sardina pilchardus TaxID=27697 RepID=UPI002E14CD2F
MSISIIRATLFCFWNITPSRTEGPMHMIIWLCAILLGLSSLNARDEFTYQQHIGCAFNRQGPVGRFWRYGFNAKDIMELDLKNEAVVAVNDEGNFMAEERQSKVYFKRKEYKLLKICSAVNTVFFESNNSLSRASKPTVRVSLEDSEGEKYLLCSVQGFYPNTISVHWVYKGKIVHFARTTTGLLPRKDGTFQIASYLSLGNETLQDIVCETEHISFEGTLQATLEDKNSVGIIVGAGVLSFFLACLTPVAVTALISCMKRRNISCMKRQSSLNESLEQSSDESVNPASVSLMDIEPQAEQDPVS